MMLDDSHEWLMWQAAKALGFNQPSVVVVELDDVPRAKRKYRKRHWSARFQMKFCRWLAFGEHDCHMVGALGYSREDVRFHIERQFGRGMSWDNYAGGRFGVDRNGIWVVDHIIPKITFERHEIKHAYAMSNLRPLWMKNNMLKGRRRMHLL